MKFRVFFTVLGEDDGSTPNLSYSQEFSIRGLTKDQRKDLVNGSGALSAGLEAAYQPFETTTSILDRYGSASLIEFEAADFPSDGSTLAPKDVQGVSNIVEAVRDFFKSQGVDCSVSKHHFDIV